MSRSIVAAVVSLAVLLGAATTSAVTLLRDPPFIQTVDRVSVRAAFFSSQGLAGEYCFNYCPPVWKAEYDQSFDEMTRGKRIRLGRDYWSSLDTFCNLEMGGQKVKPGYYFLALERGKKDDWSLVLLDHDKMRKSNIDAFGSAATKGGVMVPLRYATAPESADVLTFRLVPDAEDRQLQTLEIQWGTHLLRTSIKAKV